MKDVMTYWQAYFETLPLAFIGSVLTFYFVIPGSPFDGGHFDKHNVFQLVGASSFMAGVITLIVALVKQKSQFEIEISNRDSFIFKIQRFLPEIGGRLIQRSNESLILKKGPFQVLIRIEGNIATFSGSKIWLGSIYEITKGMER